MPHPKVQLKYGTMHGAGTHTLFICGNLPDPRAPAVRSDPGLPLNRVSY
jgi:hypothetical protein